MHIPARYYKRIPTFYFVVGVLLVITSFNMEHNPLAAYLYFMAGVVSVIYAVGVFQARRKRRKGLPPADLRPRPVDAEPVADEEQQAEEQRPAEQDRPVARSAESESATEDRDLPQHDGGVASPAQPEAKP